MPKRFFDDEFKAKKVWVDFQRHQNSSTGYKLKSQISKNKQKTSVKHTLNSEVVIKITGASKDFGNLKAHLRYISRNGELEVFSKENEIFQGKQSLKDLANSFNDFYEILSEKELEKLDKKPKREALHIVFSMKGVMKTPVDKIKKAAEQTIKELYPHHYFVLAMHQNTDKNFIPFYIFLQNTRKLFIIHHLKAFLLKKCFLEFITIFSAILAELLPHLLPHFVAFSSKIKVKRIA